MAALSLAILAPAAHAALDVDWRTPRAGDLIGNDITDDACKLRVDDRDDIRDLDIAVWRLRANRTVVKGTAGAVEVKADGAKSYVCTWDTAGVSDGFYVLRARARGRGRRVKTDEVVVYVGNRRVPRRPRRPGSGGAAEGGGVPGIGGAVPGVGGVPGVGDVAGSPLPPPLGDGCTPAPYPQRLHADPPSSVGGDVSRAFVDSTGCALQLSGFNLFPVWASGDFAFDQFHYDDIKGKRFNILRFVMPWVLYEPERGNFQNLDKLDRAIDQARKSGAYVVFDQIHIDGWNKPPPWTGYSDGQGREKMLDAIEAHGKGYVQMLARRYKDNPTVAGYDMINEPPSADNNRNLRTYSKIIGWIREVDADKIVLTNAGFGNTDMRRADPANLTFRKNVVHTWHDYWAGDGNSGSTSVGYNQYGMNAGNQTWQASKGYPNLGDAPDFEAQLKTHEDFARRANVPMWIGEFGIGPAAQNSTPWVEQKAALYRRYKIGRAWWLYKCQNGDFAPKTASCQWQALVDKFP